MKKGKLYEARIVLIAFGMLVFIWIIDRILPSHIPATILYAVPLVFVAYQLSSRSVIFFSVLLLIIHILENYLLQVPFFDWFFRTVGLGVIVYLAWQVANQKQLLTNRVKEAEIAKNHLQIFLGIVTHDLTQPLTAIKLYMELLQRNKGVKNDKRINQVVEEAGSYEQMHRMIDDLKDITHLGMSSLALIPKRMNIAQLLQTIVEDQQAISSKHHIQLISNKKITGEWDEGRMRQLFTNLLNNASKYSPKGGKIKVSVEKSDDRVVVAIADSGLGMTQVQQEQLFQPFSRLHRGQAIKGIGLGLYICKGIVDAHQGEIRVKSKINKGSTFFVELPLHQARIKTY